MKTPKRKIWKDKKSQLILQSVFPADFMSSFYPFQYYTLEEAIKTETKKGKLASKMDEYKQAIDSWKNDEVNKDEPLFLKIRNNFLRVCLVRCPVEMAKITNENFNIIYQKVRELSLGNRGIVIFSKEMILDVYYRCKFTQSEPWLMFNPANEIKIPEMFNNHRYLFNRFVMLTGIKHENSLDVKETGIISGEQS